MTTYHVLNTGSSQQSKTNTGKPNSARRRSAKGTIGLLEKNNACADVGREDESGFDDGDHHHTKAFFKEILGKSLNTRLESLFKDMVGWKMQNKGNESWRQMHNDTQRIFLSGRFSDQI
jgi:hypothetical protein